MIRIRELASFHFSVVFSHCCFFITGNKKKNPPAQPRNVWIEDGYRGLWQPDTLRKVHQI